MKTSMITTLAAAAWAIALVAGPAGAQTSAPAMPDAIAAPTATASSTDEVANLMQRVHDIATPSLVAVKFTYEGEINRRELVAPGVVVGPDGLVMVTMAFVSPALPIDQMKDFKIIIPRHDQDNDEVAATLISRDERTGYSFIRATEKREWKPITFIDKPVAMGDRVVSVGILPEMAGYTSFALTGRVSARLRGETPSILVLEGLAGMGAVVFNDQAQAIGIVSPDGLDSRLLLNDPRSAQNLLADPPRQFEETHHFKLSLEDPLPEGKPVEIPWLGVGSMAGVKKDVAEFFGLENKAAIELGDVIPGGPAEKAGLKAGDKIVAVNGQPLERGDVAEELPSILARQFRQMKVGDEVTLSIISKRDEKTPHEVKVTLGARPPQPASAERYWTDDLGFGVRSIVFFDTYARRIAADSAGVVVTVIKPQGSAQSGGLEREDLITEINGTAVTDLAQFKDTYQKIRSDTPKDAIKLVVRRDGATQVIRIEPPQ